MWPLWAMRRNHVNRREHRDYSEHFWPHVENDLAFVGLQHSGDSVDQPAEHLRHDRTVVRLAAHETPRLTRFTAS